MATTRATSPTKALKSNAGRKQETVKTGATYRLAEYMNSNWDAKVGKTNQEVADILGVRAANIISMWRTGKTKLSLERLPEIAKLMNVDLAILMPLWIEQYSGSSPEGFKAVKRYLARTVTMNEFAVIEALRKKSANTDPEFTTEQVEAAVKALV